MRVLTILTYYAPHWTGLTRFARTIAEGLAARGHEVTVLATRHEPGLAEEEAVAGVGVVRVRSVARFSRGQVAPGFPAAAWRLMRDADVVQIHTPLPEALVVAWLARRMSRPLVMTHHGDLVMPDGLFNQAVERAGTAAMRAAGALATAVTTHTRDYAEHSPFLRPFLDEIVTAYPPIDIPPPEAEAVQEWRLRLDLGGKRVIGFAGRWVEEKGFDYLLRAIPALADADPDVRLVYAGESNVGYERFFDRCLPLLEPHRDRVELVGLVRDRPRLAGLYRMCDVVAVPSRTDCFPAVQVEAMLCGTPVVVSDIPGARVPVRVTGMGVAVPARDPAALARGLLDVLARRDTYARRAQSAHDIFDRESSLDEYEGLLARVADG